MHVGTRPFVNISLRHEYTHFLTISKDVLIKHG
jgi:hypothetical protein